MKNPLLIILVLAAIAAVYFLFIKKPDSTANTTSTTTSNTGVAALFNTSAVGRLFSNIGGKKDTTTTPTDAQKKDIINTQQNALNALGFGF